MSRADEIRKRIAKRKKSQQVPTNKPKPLFWAEDEERYGFEKISSFEGGPSEGTHPLFNKELFIFKILAAGCLFLIIAILFKNDNPTFQKARNVVNQTMETDFQFATVSDWYEKKFGKPLALLPVKDSDSKKQNTADNSEYAIPATGRIIENFTENGQGIMIETEKDASVEALSTGIVVFAGTKEGYGNTVIIQHTDNTETWYGHLESIEVKKLYDFIEKGTKLGRASSSEDGTKSSYYLAVKKGDHFIDPTQVIRFE